MARIREYALMAQAAYWEEPKVEGWHVVDMWRSGTGLTEAFQGVAFASGHELVYAFKGTDAKRHETTKRDAVADASLWLGINTVQYDKAMQFLSRTRKPSTTKVTLCGHSLGGAIAQVVGNRSRLLFATFNAPGVALISRNVGEMLTSPVGPVRAALAGTIGAVAHPIQTAQDVAAAFHKTRGVNFRLGKDVVGVQGVHIGRVIELPFSGSALEVAKLETHGIDVILAAVVQSSFGEVPLEVLAG